MIIIIIISQVTLYFKFSTAKEKLHFCFFYLTPPEWADVMLNIMHNVRSDHNVAENLK